MKTLPTRMLPVLAILIILVTGRAALGDAAPTLPLNTLAFVSSEVVQATIVGPYDNPKNKWDYGALVRVDAVFAGSLKPDKTIKVGGLLTYTKIQRNLSTQSPVEKGDRVWLFLQTPSMAQGVPEQSRSPEERADDEGKWVPVTSGVYLISDGKVLTPRQSRGPYAFALSSDEKPPTIEQFSTSVDKAVNEAAGIRARLSKPADGEDQSWALRMLKARNPENLGLWDPLVHALLIRLGESHDLALAQQAIEDPKLPIAEAAFAFSCPEGRELLLKKLADPILAPETKLRYLEAVRLAGPFYGLVARLDRQHGSNVWNSDGKDVPGNGRYLQRLAQIVKSSNLTALTEKVPGWTWSIGSGAGEKLPEAAQDEAKARELLQK